MKCNKCGQEFGKGETCQNCGADKVSALGEFTGYTTPKHQSTNETIAPSSSSTHIDPVTSQVCWKCGEIIPLGKFCPVCGQDLFRECPKCQTQYSSQYHICPSCGTNHIEYEKELKKKKQDEEEAAHEQKLNTSLRRYKEEAEHVKIVCNQVWVKQEQKEALLPLLNTLDKEVNKVYYVTKDYELSGIENALWNLRSNSIFQQIKAEHERKEEENNTRKRLEAEKDKTKNNVEAVFIILIFIGAFLALIFGF